MSTISAHYLSRAETWLFVTTLVYFLMNGAQIFETAVITPKWTASPPESLNMLQGEYGLDLKKFWIAMHSIHEVTFILAIVFCWKIAPVRNLLLILFFIHFAVRFWTILYFAPNLIEFQKMDSINDEADLLDKVTLWKKLNYIRVGVFIAVSLALIPLCLKIMNIKTISQ